MTGEPPRLTWRNVSTHNLRDFEGYDGERLVARILQEPNGNHDWRWSVFAICPAIPGLTNGIEADPKGPAVKSRRLGRWPRRRAGAIRAGD